jgi:hypothetical protein
MRRLKICYLKMAEICTNGINGTDLRELHATQWQIHVVCFLWTFKKRNLYRMYQNSSEKYSRFQKQPPEIFIIFCVSSTVDIATDFELDVRGVRSSPRGASFSPLHIIQTGSGPYPASYPVGTAGSSPDGKAAAACSW